MAYEIRETKNLSRVSPRLLRWYDKNARVLPWRIGPGTRKAGGHPDPYRVWLSEIMLQQTTVATVSGRYQEFITRWPDVSAIGDAPLDDVLGQWAGLGYYARARNLHKCANLVANEFSGKFPDTEESLKKLPGIGDYTAAAIAAIAYDKPAIVIDGNIERVVSRIFAVATPLPAAKPRLKKLAGDIWPKKRSGDFAQALMDLGALICKPRMPICGQCPLSADCDAFSQGRAETYPVKAAKKPKPTRLGAAFVLANKKGEVLFERRPEKGLLGGMLGLPGSPWVEKQDGAVLENAPTKTDWGQIGQVKHTFTHFHLLFDVYLGAAPKTFRRKENQKWIAPKAARLPTVMKKALDLAIPITGDRK